MLHIALAKGRISEQVIAFLEAAGIHFPEYNETSRKLIFIDDTDSFKITLVKSPDVPVYVERGAADVGVVGKDILEEHSYSLYEICDLGVGRCRMAVAGIKGRSLPTGRRLVVGTKYPTIARKYYASLGERVDIVPLNGSVELAPLVGLSDVIVDIVESGNTLRENGLEALTFFMDLSARLIVNKGAFRFKRKAIDRIIACTKGGTEDGMD